MKNNIFLISILFIALIMTSCSNNSIQLGGILPLSGDASTYGLPLQKSMELAVIQINKAGGINGKDLEIIWEDGKCESSAALTAAKKLTEVNNVRIIVGGGCSSEILGAAPHTERKKVILITPVASSPKISKSGDYVFRTGYTDTARAEVLAKYLNKKSGKDIFAIIENTDYGIGFLNAFKNASEKNVKENLYSSQDELETIISKLENEKILLVPQNLNSGKLILKELKEKGITKDIYGNEAFLFPGILREENLLPKNLYVTDIVLDDKTQQYLKFQEKFKEKYGEECSLGIYCAISYDLIYQMKRTIEQCNTNTDCIKNTLHNTSFNGAAGSLTFDNNGDAIREFAMFKYSDGKFKRIENE